MPDQDSPQEPPSRPRKEHPQTHPPIDPPSEDYTALQAGAPFNTAATGYSGETSGHGPGHRPVGGGYGAPDGPGFTGPPPGGPGPGGSGSRTGRIVAIIAAVVLIVAAVVLAVVLLGDDSEADPDSRGEETSASVAQPRDR